MESRAPATRASGGRTRVGKAPTVSANGQSGFGSIERRDPADNLDAGIDSELVEDVRHVALDRSFGDEELRGRIWRSSRRPP